MVYLYTKFNEPSSNSSLVIASKGGGHQYHKCCTHMKSLAYLLKIYCQTSFQDPRLCVAPTSHECVFSILLLLIVGNHEVYHWGGFQSHNADIQLCANQSTGTKLAMKSWRKGRKVRDTQMHVH
jgi:hypothetical protein